MLEKQGVINERNTIPELKDEKDLEKHFTKRAAAVITERLKHVPLRNVLPAEQLKKPSKRARDND